MYTYLIKTMEFYSLILHISNFFLFNVEIVYQYYGHNLHGYGKDCAYIDCIDTCSKQSMLEYICH